MFARGLAVQAEDVLVTVIPESDADATVTIGTPAGSATAIAAAVRFDEYGLIEVDFVGVDQLLIELCR